MTFIKKRTLTGWRRARLMCTDLEREAYQMAREMREQMELYHVDHRTGVFELKISWRPKRKGEK